MSRRARRRVHQVGGDLAGGIYKVERLTDAIEHYYLELRNSANPNHLVASGWIAIPDEISMDEAQAAKLFYAAGAWHQVKVAA
ncbi:hypothetical protein PS865_01149 [Pseudomonas fluorescens]|nr:hypothetical protein PS865_01149 [Pseudomonas fluorescens]